MRSLCRLSLAVLFLLPAACSSTGGTWLGLFPAPKILDGDIEDGIYTAEGGVFSVQVPYKEGSHEYRYMAIKEEQNELEWYVSFGPAVDQAIFRINYVERMEGMPIQPLDELAPKALELYVSQLEQGYGAPTRPEEERAMTMGNTPARYWKLTQTAPAGKLANVDVEVVHEVISMDLGTGFVSFCLQSPEASSQGTAQLEAFARSFTLR